jgi:hypothetical protein
MSTATPIDAAPDSGAGPLEDLDLRASRMPIATECPGSIRRPRVRIAGSGAEARLGTATHVMLARVVEDQPWAPAHEVAGQYRCDEGELRMLVSLGSQMWRHVASSFPSAWAEVAGSIRLPSGHRLTGTMDILSRGDVVVRVGDWKSGRKDSDYRPQLMAYAAIAMDGRPDIVEATATVLWIRSLEIENHTVTRGEVERWLREVDERIVRWDGVYHPGPHCTYCPRAHECEARSAMVRRSIADVMETTLDASALACMTPDAILELHHRVQIITAVAEKVHDALTAHVEDQGDVVGSDGRRLTIGIETRKQLATLKAFDVLERLGFGDDAWAECMSISLGKAKDWIKGRAPKGRGAKAARELEQHLERAGAITPVEIRKLVTRRG